MITILLNGMISLINMTYEKVRKDPDLTEYDKELLRHLLSKGKRLTNIFIRRIGNWELGINQSLICRAITLFNKSAKV